MNINFLKLDINILDDSKIKLIRQYPDGNALFVLWIGLLCLAMKSSQPGYIYITNEIPYNETDLASLFKLEVKTIQMGLSLFKKYHMIDIFNNGIIEITNFNKHQRLDKIEKAQQASRESSRKFREKNQRLLISDNTDNQNSKNPYNGDSHVRKSDNITNSDVRKSDTTDTDTDTDTEKDIYIDSDFKKNHPDTYPSDDDIIIYDDPPSPPPIDEIKNSPKREFPSRKTDPYELPHRLCNQFANEFNKRFGQAIGGHIGYSRAIDIFNNSPDPALYFNQALEAIPYFFDTPDWYNTNPNDRKTVLWRKCTLQVFLANLPGIIAACQQDKKQQTEKPYDQMTHEEQAEYREKIRLRLEREGE